jgi:hypothetical protein
MATKKSSVGSTTTNAVIDILPEKVQQQALDLPTQVDKIKSIVTDAELSHADQLDRDMDALLKEIGAEYDPAIKRWHDGHKAELARKKKWWEPVEVARQKLRRMIGSCLDQRRIEAAKETERLRKESEEQARIEAERDQERRAQALADAGDLEGAVEVMTDTVVVDHVAVVKVEVTKPLGFGMSQAEYWSAELTSNANDDNHPINMELVKAVAEGKVPLFALEANMVYLNKVASSDKTTMMIPGVRAVKSLSPRRSGR